MKKESGASSANAIHHFPHTTALNQTIAQILYHVRPGLARRCEKSCKGMVHMETSYLEAFANGNLQIQDRIYRRSSAYDKALKEACRAEDALRETLNGAEKELFEKMISAEARLHSLSETDRFIHGYRLGVRMTMEVFTGRDDLMFGGEA